MKDVLPMLWGRIQHLGEDGATHRKGQGDVEMDEDKLARHRRA
jgi:hypothetical protein